MVADLNPNDGVPDALYEVLHWEAETPEEVCAGRVLRVHRDWLNGGFEQTFDNLEAIEEQVAPYIVAYSQLGLPTVGKIVEEAAAAWRTAPSDQEWEALDARYERLTYGQTGDQPDAIEAAVVGYIQTHLPAFASAIFRAEQ